MLKFYFKYLCYVQGAVRPAILYMDRSCSSASWSIHITFLTFCDSQAVALASRAT